MTAIRVIGIGSPFGSDRAGWDAIEGLYTCSQLKDIDANVISLIKLDRPGVGLLDYIQGAEAVILIDAIKAGLEPGCVVRLKNEQIDSSDNGISTHGFGVADALILGRTLDNLPGRVILIGLETGEEAEWTPSHKDMEELVKTIVSEIEGSIKYLCSITS